MNIFEKLSQINTASGAEKALTEALAKEFEGIAREIRYDAMGNLIVKIGNDTQGTKASAVFLPVDAPCALTVTYIEQDGKIRVSPLGECDGKSLCFAELTNGRINGIFVCDGTSTEDIKKGYADFGFENDITAKEHLALGDTLFSARPAIKLLDGRVSGVGIGNKALCAAVCMAKNKLAQKGCVYFVFCTQSGLSGRGAYPAAYGVKTDKALCLSVYEGENFGVKALDKSLVCDRALTDAAFAAAVKYDSDAQRVVLPDEISDAGKIQCAGEGIRLACIMLPVKHKSSAIETVSAQDVTRLADIISEFLNNI